MSDNNTSHTPETPPHDAVENVVHLVPVVLPLVGAIMIFSAGLHRGEDGLTAPQSVPRGLCRQKPRSAGLFFAPVIDWRVQSSHNFMRLLHGFTPCLTDKSAAGS